MNTMNKLNIKKFNCLHIFIFTIFMVNLNANQLPKNWFKYSDNGFQITEKDLGKFKGYGPNFRNYNNLSKKENLSKSSIVFAHYEKEILKDGKKVSCYYSVRIDNPKEHNYYMGMPYCSN